MANSYTVIAGAGKSAAVGGGTVQDALGLTASAIIDPITGDLTITAAVTPPASLGGIIGWHLYLECPDQSSAAPFVSGSSLAGSAVASGPWAPIDCGKQPYSAATQPWILTVPAPTSIDPTNPPPCRLYAVAYSANTENALVQANQPNATPSVVFTPVPAGTQNSAGTNVTAISGLIVATALPVDNSTGKLLRPVLVDVASVPNNIPGWCYRLVLTLAGQDPTNPANQRVVTGIETTTGPVPSGTDGITTPHSFAVDEPTSPTNAIVWLQSGLIDAGGNFQPNNIVPAVTPHFPISYGTTTGVTDASQVMQATIAARMSVTNGLLDLATGGVSNQFLGTGAVATINIQNLAITNPLLASLCVQAANLAASSVTSTAIAALAVGTAAIQTGAITNALIANAAVGAANIISATITSAQIASATIAGANIASATIVQGNMASASIGTAQIQSLAVTDAKINDLSASKITAGTISASISISAPTITGGSITSTSLSSATITGSTLVLNSGGITTTINNGSVGSIGSTGLAVKNNSTLVQCGVSSTTIFGLDASGNSGFTLATVTILTSFGQLILYNAGSASININAGGPSISILGNQVLSTRVVSTPVTLADVIAVLQHHGLSN